MSDVFTPTHKLPTLRLSKQWMTTTFSHCQGACYSKEFAGCIVLWPCLFCSWVFSRFYCCNFVAVWQPQVFMPLGIFWLFGETNLWKTKQIWTISFCSCVLWYPSVSCTVPRYPSTVSCETPFAKRIIFHGLWSFPPGPPQDEPTGISTFGVACYLLLVSVCVRLCLGIFPKFWNPGPRSVTNKAKRWGQEMCPLKIAEEKTLKKHETEDIFSKNIQTLCSSPQQKI